MPTYIDYGGWVISTIVGRVEMTADMHLQKTLISLFYDFQSSRFNGRPPPINSAFDSPNGISFGGGAKRLILVHSLLPVISFSVSFGRS
jgi:hypothetical protein